MEGDSSIPFISNTKNGLVTLQDETTNLNFFNREMKINEIKKKKEY